MTKEEQKEKYSNFIADVSEILGLGKPIDILKLCQVTDRFFRPLQDKVTELEEEKCELLGIIQGKDTAIHDLQKENKILTKALNLYINWADECGIAWDNFPDEKEKWLKTVEEKGFGWIEGLTFMVMEEAKEQLKKEEQND